MIPFCILAIEDEDDRAFMTNLYLDYQRLLYQQIYKIMNNHHDTEDVMQMVLVKLISKIDLLRTRTKSQLVNYIISAAKNTARNAIRDKSHIHEFDFDDCEEYSYQTQNVRDLEFSVINRETMATFAEKWNQLDERSRYLLEGRYILGKSDAELATALGVQANSVRMAITRAKKSAFALLKNEIDVLVEV